MGSTTRSIRLTKPTVEDGDETPLAIAAAGRRRAQAEAERRAFSAKLALSRTHVAAPTD